MYSHAWRRSHHKIVLWKKGEQTIKQPVAVSDVANGIANAMLDRSTSGKTYQAVGYDDSNCPINVALNVILKNV